MDCHSYPAMNIKLNTIRLQGGLSYIMYGGVHLFRNLNWIDISYNYEIMIDIKKACKILNEAILKKEPGFMDIVNLTMNQIYQEGGELYWDRDIFIDCNGEDERMRDLVRKSDNVFFEPHNDPGEHPGVVVRYKHKYYVGDMFREKENPGNFWVITDILPNIHGSIGSIYILESLDDEMRNRCECCEQALENNFMIWYKKNYFFRKH